MLTQNGTGYIKNDGYFVTEYDENWNVTNIYKDTDNGDNKVATENVENDVVVSYTYTIGDVEYTYHVNTDGDVTGYTETWMEEWTDESGTHSISYTYKYDEQGAYQGHIYSDGTKTDTYDAEGNFVSSLIDSSELVDEGNNTYSYTDEFGVKTLYSDQGVTVTGYITNYTWDGGSETTEFDANWNMVSTSITEGSKTTTYDSNWNVIGTTTDFSSLPESSEDGVTVYTETHDWGGVTKYYVDAENKLVKYTESHSGSYEYTDGEGNAVTSSYTNSYTFDANGKPLSESNSHTESNGATYSYSTTHHYNDSGILTGHTSTNSWSDSYGSGTSTTQFDPDWNETGHTSSGTNTYTYIDENGAEKTGTTSYSQTTSFDSDGNLDGYTTTNSWDGGSETINYDPDWNMQSATITEGSKTTTYDSNWTIQGTTFNYDELPESTEGEYTVYTETDSWGGITKYYLDNSGQLVKYIETYSGSYAGGNGQNALTTYENSRTYDADGNLIAESGKTTEADGSEYSYSTVNNYADDNTTLTGYTTTNEWSNSQGKGSSEIVYGPDWKVLSESGTNTYIYFDEEGNTKEGTSSYSTATHYEGNEVSGYTTTYDWGDGSETTEYGADWTIKETSITEGIKTTTYDYVNGTENTTFNFPDDLTGLPVDEESGLRVYTEADDWGGETKYYIDTDNTLVKYTETYRGSYADWNDENATTTYENSRTYDAIGNLIAESGKTTEADGSVHSYSTVNNYVEGTTTLTGSTSSNEWSNSHGKGTSTTIYNADGKVLSENGTNTYTYVDEEGNTKESTNEYSTITHYENDEVSGYTTTHDWGDGSETTEYNADWTIKEISITEGIKTVTYDKDWNVVDTTFNFGDLTTPPETEGVYKVYSESDSWGGETKYYLDTSNNLVKYTESNSGSYANGNDQSALTTYENSRTYDADGNLIAESGKTTEADGSEYSYSTVNNYADDDTTLTGYTTTNEWSNSQGKGSSETLYGPDWKVLSESGTNTYFYVDEEGNTKEGKNSYSTVTHYEGNDVSGYTTTHDWGNGSETSVYDDEWNLLSSSHTEGIRTFTYNHVTQTEETTFNFPEDLTGLPVDEVSGYRVYTETDDWGGETKYYLDTDNTLVKYTESYSGSYDYTGDAGTTATNTYSNSYTYDADGNLLSESGSNTDSNGAEYSYSTVHHYEGVDGALSGHTSTNTWSDNYGSGTSTTVFDAEWNEISRTSSGENSYTYIDDNGNEQTGTNSHSTTNNYDLDGNLTGYTTTNEWSDANGSGISTTTYNADGHEIGSSSSNTYTYIDENGASQTGTNSHSTTRDYDGNTLTGYTIEDKWTNEFGTGTRTEKYNSADLLLSQVETGQRNQTFTDNGVDQTRTVDYTKTAHVDNGQITGYTMDDSWTEDGNLVTNSYELDAGGNPINDGTNGPTDGGSGNRTDNYEGNVLVSYTITDSWTNPDGNNGTRTATYDPDDKLLSEVITGQRIDTFNDGNGDQTRTVDYIKTAHVDNGQITGYTVDDSWTEGADTVTVVYELDANGNPINDGTDGPTDGGSGNRTDNYEGNVLVSYTITDSWTNPDGNNGTRTATYDPDDKLLSEVITGQRIDTFNDGTGNQTRTVDYIKTAHVDNGQITGYTVDDSWTEGADTVTVVYELDANGNPVNDGTEGPTDGGSGNRTDNYAGDVLVSYTITDSWTNPDGNNGTRTATYDPDDKLLSEVITGQRIDTFNDGSGDQTRTVDYIKTAHVDNGQITGYTVDDSWTEGADTVTVVYELDAGGNPINNGTEGPTDGGSGNRTDNYAGDVLVSYTITDSWTNPDGNNGTRTATYDPDDKLLSEVITGQRIDTFNDGSGDQTRTVDYIKTAHVDNGQITGYTVDDSWTEGADTVTVVYELDAGGNPVNNGTEGPTDGGSGNRTDNYNADGTILLSYTIEDSWTNPDGTSGSRTATYDHPTDQLLSESETSSFTYTDDQNIDHNATYTRDVTYTYDETGQLLSETSNEKESYMDGDIEVIIEDTQEVTNAVIEDQSGTPTLTGYTSTETFDELGFGAGELISTYDVDGNMTSGTYEYANATETHSGSRMEVEIEDTDGQAVIGHTEVELRSGTDGDRFEVNVHNGDWTISEEYEGVWNAPVSGSVSDATLTENLNTLLNVEGSGFNTLVQGDVSAAVVTENTGTPDARSWLAIDSNANDSFDEGDELIEITGTNLVGFNNDIFQAV